MTEAHKQSQEDFIINLVWTARIVDSLKALRALRQVTPEVQDAIEGFAQLVPPWARNTQADVLTDVIVAVPRYVSKLGSWKNALQMLERAQRMTRARPGAVFSVSSIQELLWEYEHKLGLGGGKAGGGGAGPARGSSSHSSGPQSKGACRFHNTPQGCKYGDKCKSGRHVCGKCGKKGHISADCS